MKKILLQLIFTCFLFSELAANDLIYVVSKDDEQMVPLSNSAIHIIDDGGSGETHCVSRITVTSYSDNACSVDANGTTIQKSVKLTITDGDTLYIKGDGLWDFLEDDLGTAPTGRSSIKIAPYNHENWAIIPGPTTAICREMTCSSNNCTVSTAASTTAFQDGPTPGAC